jgi:hypothetical protein
MGPDAESAFREEACAESETHGEAATGASTSSTVAEAALIERASSIAGVQGVEVRLARRQMRVAVQGLATRPTSAQANLPPNVDPSQRSTPARRTLAATL